MPVSQPASQHTNTKIFIAAAAAIVVVVVMLSVDESLEFESNFTKMNHTRERQKTTTENCYFVFIRFACATNDQTIENRLTRFTFGINMVYIAVCSVYCV